MKEELLTLANKMKENGQDLVEQPVLFKWSYPEQMEFEFQLLVKENDPNEVVLTAEDFSPERTLN